MKAVGVFAVLSVMVGGREYTLLRQSSQSATLRFSKSGSTYSLSTNRVRTDEILSLIAKELDCDVIADIPNTASPVTVSVTGDAASVLNALATKSDLEWRRVGRSVLFSQCFKKEGTQPQLKAEEIRSVSKDIASVFDSISGSLVSDRPSVALLQLANSLTTQQADTLQHSGQLSCSTLSSDQISCLQRAMHTMYLGIPAQAWKQLNDELNRVPSSYFELRDAPAFYDRRANVAERDRSSGPIRWELTWVTPIRLNQEYTYVVPVDPPMPSHSRLEPKDELQGNELNSRLYLRSCNGEESPASTVTQKSNGLISAHLGQTTVKTVADVIGKLSGLKVDVSPGVADREIFVWSSDVAPKSLLEQIAVLDGWTLREMGNGRLDLSRTKVRLPKTTAEISASLLSCLPPELIRFLGIGMPLEKLPPISNEKLLKDLEATRRFALDYSRSYAIASTRWRLQKMEDEQKRKLAVISNSFSSSSRRIASTELTKHQREAIFSALIIRALSTFARPDSNFIGGNLTPLQKDVSSAEIRLQKDGSLVVRSTWFENGAERMTAFGADIRSLGSPLRLVSP